MKNKTSCYHGEIASIENKMEADCFMAFNPCPYHYDKSEWFKPSIYDLC